MRLSRIEIENFKGIGAAQIVDLKPITLLFGPNSAGKSTILQSLHYLREILERRNADPDQTIAGGLIVSQLLTLFTTPVIYLGFDSLARRLRERFGMESGGSSGKNNGTGGGTGGSASATTPEA